MIVVEELGNCLFLKDKTMSSNGLDRHRAPPAKARLVGVGAQV